METKRNKVIKILLALIIRICLLAECAVSLTLTTCIMGTAFYWIAGVNLVIIIIDGFYCCLKRNGEEYKWHSNLFIF
jgi:hypothetical protein